MAGAFFKSWPALFPASDEQAMWRVKMEDDPQAFAQIVRKWEAPIRALCTRMTGDAHRGEDLAQEAFTRVFARRKDYEPAARFSTFLWRVALNLCYDELRKIKRRRETFLEDETLGADARGMPSESPGPDLRLVAEERAEAVRRALLQLAEPYRAVAVLRHYEGLKFREIGEVLDIPEGTAKSRMAEALGQLNEILSQTLRDEGRAKCKPETKQIREIPVP